jgi:hypothetical protein
MADRWRRAGIVEWFDGMLFFGHMSSSLGRLRSVKAIKYPGNRLRGFRIDAPDWSDIPRNSEVAKMRKVDNV